MSGGVEALQLKEEDVVKFLAASVHLGASNADFQMENYIYKRKPDGGWLIFLPLNFLCIIVLTWSIIC